MEAEALARGATWLKAAEVELKPRPGSSQCSSRKHTDGKRLRDRHWKLGLLSLSTALGNKKCHSSYLYLVALWVQ